MFYVKESRGGAGVSKTGRILVKYGIIDTSDNTEVLATSEELYEFLKSNPAITIKGVLTNKKGQIAVCPVGKYKPDLVFEAISRVLFNTDLEDEMSVSISKDTGDITLHSKVGIKSQKDMLLKIVDNMPHFSDLELSLMTQLCFINYIENETDLVIDWKNYTY